MNKSSIFFSITLTFVALFVFILISLGVLYKHSQKREELFTQKRSVDILHSIKNEMRKQRVLTQEFKEYLQLMNFVYLQDKFTILENPHKEILWSQEKRRISLQVFKVDEKNYLYIKSPKLELLLLDTYETDNSRVLLLLVFTLIIFSFVLLYLNIIRKLKPLKILKKSLKNIANEEYKTLYLSDKKDEISELAREFDKSAKKLQALKNSRDVFIRNIMHELKTPITKGQFLLKLPTTQENKSALERVFYKLESLINEFASIEELISTKNELQKKEYFLSDILENASDLLMNEEENIMKEFEDIRLKVDFKLFSIAVKNLLDNALKYSNDKKVIVKTEGLSIIISNKGEKLMHPLENYFEPFFKSENTNALQSFGLGLYITKHILDANQFSLKYEYKNGVNHFIVS